MSSCYIAGHLPLLNSTVPDSAKPKSTLSDTVLYVDDDTELEAQMWSYQPTGALPDGMLAFVVAKLSGDGTSPPLLEAINIVPLEDVTTPFQPNLFAIGTVTKVRQNEKSFILSGQEYIASSFFFFLLYEIQFTDIWVGYRITLSKLYVALQDGGPQICKDTFACTRKESEHHGQGFRSAWG